MFMFAGGFAKVQGQVSLAQPWRLYPLKCRQIWDQGEVFFSPLLCFNNNDNKIYDNYKKIKWYSKGDCKREAENVFLQVIIPSGKGDGALALCTVQFVTLISIHRKNFHYYF